MASAFKIEKGIPVPPSHCASVVYPFGDMEVGDSFEAPDLQSVRKAATIYGQRHSKRFVCRKPVRKGSTIRVWRVA